MRLRETGRSSKNREGQVREGRNNRSGTGAQGRGSPQLEAFRETSLARGTSAKEAIMLALSERASPIRPWGVSGSAKPLMGFSGKILMEYSPVV